MKIEKKALFEYSSTNAIMEAFRVTNPKELEINIEDSVGQKPDVNWFHVGTIIYGGSDASTMVFKGLCDVGFGKERFSRFEAKCDTEFKSGVINFAA